MGSHATEVIHRECALMGEPTFSPVAGSQRIRTPFLSAETSLLALGLHARQRMWFLWPRHVCLGREVLTSQKRTVVSPPPEARWRPSPEKDTKSTASVCPGMVSVQRVTGRTLKTARGW